MEEGASSVEVQELQLKLESADKKNQRIMEAFKKTSKVSSLFGSVTSLLTLMFVC